MENSDNQSGTFIGSNDDLLTEILIRLPVTSILRFKSVSKHWRSLLTHTRFTHRYDNFSKSPGLFAGDTYVPFDVEDRSTSPFRSLDFYFNRFNVTIVQSCNGLLLCSAFDNNGDIEYYVFNPTTKQRAFIPLPPKNIRSMALAFHPTHCVHYKVVCICFLDPFKNLCQIQVYSSTLRKWKICIESFTVHKPIFHDVVYWNGAIYWSTFYRSINYFYYSLDVEQLKTFPLPEGLVSSEILIMYFGESGGHLHLMLHSEREVTSLRMNVYEMLMDHSGWFVKYQVQLDELPGAFSSMVFEYGYDFQVVDVVRGKAEEDTFLVIFTLGKLIRYNVHDKSFKEICSYNYDYFELSDFYRYIEALSSF